MKRGFLRLLDQFYWSCIMVTYVRKSLGKVLPGIRSKDRFLRLFSEFRQLFWQNIIVLLKKYILTFLFWQKNCTKDLLHILAYLIIYGHTLFFIKIYIDSHGHSRALSFIKMNEKKSVFQKSSFLMLINSLKEGTIIATFF